MTTHCFACTKPRSLTEEHIIPQAIGGKLKPKLYCKKCNETIGEVLDNEISKQFGWIGTLLNIKRERGELQPYELIDRKTGTKLSCDGKSLKRKTPIVKVNSKDGVTLDSADVTARTEEELKKICDSIQKRYQIPGGMKTFQESKPGPTNTEHVMVIDNKLLRRAVSKIAYGFACIKLPQKVIFSSKFDNIRNYIKSSNKSDLASANFLHTGFMTDHVRPIHKIHISLNRDKELLIGFVSLFGIFRFTIVLAERFKSNLEWAGLDYTYDPVSRKQVLGNDNFRAPRLSRDNILRPKQSKTLVQNELNRGYKTLDAYTKDVRSLGGEFCEEERDA
ncbi:MAG: HNH endonuclease [Desulfurivibrionaceae bacterium]